jgi:hypothetical protein
MINQPNTRRVRRLALPVNQKKFTMRPETSHIKMRSISPKQALFALDVTGVCPQPVTEIIHGWSQYSDSVEKLPIQERSKIKVLAELVVASFTTNCQPLGQIVVIGHADHDVHGPKFEKKVSDERALSVSASLGKAITETWIERGMGDFSRGAVAFDPPHTALVLLSPMLQMSHM